MTMLRPLQQAKELQNRVRNALREIRCLDTKGFAESEVMFRLEAIAGILRIALNDIDGLVEAWAHDPD